MPVNLFKLDFLLEFLELARIRTSGSREFTITAEKPYFSQGEIWHNRYATFVTVRAERYTLLFICSNMHTDKNAEIMSDEGQWPDSLSLSESLSLSSLPLSSPPPPSLFLFVTHHIFLVKRFWTRKLLLGCKPSEHKSGVSLASIALDDKRWAGSCDVGSTQCQQQESATRVSLLLSS